MVAIFLPPLDFRAATRYIVPARSLFLNVKSGVPFQSRDEKGIPYTRFGGQKRKLPRNCTRRFVRLSLCKWEDSRCNRGRKPGDLPESSVLNNLRGKIRERHDMRVFCSTLSLLREDGVFCCVEITAYHILHTPASSRPAGVRRWACCRGFEFRGFQSISP